MRQEGFWDENEEVLGFCVLMGDWYYLGAYNHTAEKFVELEAAPRSAHEQLDWENSFRLHLSFLVVGSRMSLEWLEKEGQPFLMRLRARVKGFKVV